MLDSPSHLNQSTIVNMGSYYTPHKYVMMAGKWLSDIGIDSDWTIMDSSCGYGAFFNLQSRFSNNRFIGNDIDMEATKTAHRLFPFVEMHTINALHDIKRSQYGIAEDEKLIIVGNPPYNDTTSQVHQTIKTQKIMMDKDVLSRDLGLSSLLSYNKLHADYVLILHPLSYLIKKANFSKASDFFTNYLIINHIVFSSAEFANTSANSAFPIIMALYKRCDNNGEKYEKVPDMVFNTASNSFSISRRDYVGNYVKKYPHSERYDPEILFYTLRDINALKRSRTFIRERINNAVDVDPKKLAYYCYIDCFKKYAVIPYYLGNLDIPFIKDQFSEIQDLVIKISKYNHPDVFGKSEKPTDNDIIKVKEYINKVLAYKKAERT